VLAPKKKAPATKEKPAVAAAGGAAKPKAEKKVPSAKTA
jgi:hypothetical protein